MSSGARSGSRKQRCLEVLGTWFRRKQTLRVLLDKVQAQASRQTRICFGETCSGSYPSLDLRCNSEGGVSQTGSNRRPLASKAKALPLSYKGDARKLGSVRSLANGMRAVPGWD
ncbi:hypothetical protein PC123_g24135 [Phytophthora cactorum]|nr:hypothetical protein PC123_g24135 [Phytophthora cactorum]